MSIEAALVKLLQQDAQVVAALGSSTGGIYPIRMPQNATLPAVSYQLISNVPAFSLSGSSQYGTATIQVDVFADSFTACIDLAAKISRALSAFRGSSAGVDVQLVQETNSLDIPEDEPHEKPIFHRAIDFDITYTTSGPE